MNARDELAELVRVVRTGPLFSMTTKEAGDIADALLAAGYRKPRTITTAEELDSLPNGTVVMDSEPDVLAKKGDKWQSPNYDGERFESRELDFPVTLIHEGAAA